MTLVYTTKVNFSLFFYFSAELSLSENCKRKIYIYFVTTRKIKGKVGFLLFKNVKVLFYVCGGWESKIIVIRIGYV